MKIRLLSLAKLLNASIHQKGDIRYIQINDVYVITENPLTKEIELNSLETYDSQPLTSHNVADMLELKFVQIMKAKQKHTVGRENADVK
ncbi:hypothetical protein [Olivibacter sp. XZL3]|uniref:hypothetical protein n=1 Tax=Olivibacter sp. XZL3 TaxID=1735116 RepID=UPI0010647DE7|nr:hypothetical protein [Olivibacter sp. XZL3]